jgi:hypothetical protein
MIACPKLASYQKPLSNQISKFQHHNSSLEGQCGFRRQAIGNSVKEIGNLVKEISERLP